MPPLIFLLSWNLSDFCTIDQTCLTNVLQVYPSDVQVKNRNVLTADVSIQMLTNVPQEHTTAQQMIDATISKDHSTALVCKIRLDFGCLYMAPIYPCPDMTRCKAAYKVRGVKIFATLLHREAAVPMSNAL